MSAQDVLKIGFPVIFAIVIAYAILATFLPSWTAGRAVLLGILTIVTITIIVRILLSLYSEQRNTI